jgi:D-alanyl-D-alanine carboxypeptidase
MKDSQKKKQKSEKKINNIFVNFFSYTYLFTLYSVIKKNFIWIFTVLTLVNLLLSIAILAFVGQMKPGPQQNDLTDLYIPDFPTIKNASSDISISAESVLVYEKDSRSVVMQKRGNLRFAPASTTKIMTALVALDHYTVDQYLSAYGVSTVLGSNMGLVEGEEIKVIDLLYGLMLPSGNDAAHVLASQYPGGKESFIAEMNRKAEEYRLYNTHFRDPAGLDDGNYTTAFDLARLALIGLENDVLKKIVETRNITVYDRTFVYEHRLENLNKLLYTDGIFGVKTGYTDEAGQVLVTSAQTNGKTYIIVVLKSEDRFLDTQTILSEVIEKIQFERF